MPRFAALLLLLTLPLQASCVVAVAGVGAAIGIWAYDDASDDSGEIILDATPDRVYRGAEAVARERGLEVQTYPGPMRVQFDAEDYNARFEIFLVEGREDVARLRVSARSGLRGRPEIAEELGLAVRETLKAWGH
ncbi:MAG: hypothetical protein DWQ01_07935 [Planctomycetota bacterium]|nr:MAG: hypothetical protein DWQ01_07935 [Planctomycetota bacterium]